MPLIPVVLSGGSGSRLWPLSRKLYPKQFIPFKEGQSLYQATLARIAALGSAIITICNDEHRFMVAEQVRQSNVGYSDIILEPVGRNTAPAIVIAALHALSKEQDAYLLILPADHTLGDQKQFQLAIQHAQRAAQKNLVTFGVFPTRAETGFGYIRYKKNDASDHAFPITEFVEKPDVDNAKAYLDSGEYLWNSGMFLFRAQHLLQEMEIHQPEIVSACKQAYKKARKDPDFIRLDEQSFANAPNTSIDYAVMEKTRQAVVVPLNGGWNDMGSWHALWESFERDENENVIHGDVVAQDCEGCLIHAEHRLVTAVGIQDQIIVETADAVLAIPKERTQDVKEMVTRLQSMQRDEADIHPKVYRPWGAYETVDIGDRFRVKRITVNPLQKLSLQAHRHRAEHWIVVKGTARVTCDKEEFLLSENESTYIPIGTRHRLENPGKIPLRVIEVQSGAYLGEDDIERFDDIYGRQA